jgi:ComF family protein
VLKYAALQPVTRGLGRMLASAVAQLDGEDRAEMLVVPVPLHRSKHAQRGFNQAHLLAREALRCLDKSHPAWRLTLATGILTRQRATASQAGLTAHQRRENLRGAFSVSDPAAVADRHILLVDDVMTTGATARAASEAVMRAGAASVRVATLARTRWNLGESPATFGDAEDAHFLAGRPAALSTVIGSDATNSSAGQPSLTREQ